MQYCGETSGMPLGDKIKKTTIDTDIIGNVSVCLFTHRITKVGVGQDQSVCDSSTALGRIFAVLIGGREILNMAALW